LIELEERALKLRAEIQLSLQKSRDFKAELDADSEHHIKLPEKDLLDEWGLSISDSASESFLDQLEDEEEHNLIIDLLNPSQETKIESANEEILPNDPNNALPSLELKLPKNIISSLSNVYCAKITFLQLELLENLAAPEILWIEYSLPDWNIDRPQGRIRVKVPKKKLNTGVYKLDQTVKVPIIFDDLKIQNWINSTLKLKIIALASHQHPKRKIGSNLAESVDITEIWSFLGFVNSYDTFVADAFSWQGDAAIFTPKEYIQNSNASKIKGHVSMQLQLVPEEKSPQVLKESDTINSSNLSSVTKRLESEVVKSEALYLSLEINRVRAVFTTTPCLLFLKVRLISSENIIETSPITYVNNFDASGNYAENNTFNFKHVIPIPISNQFLESSRKSPIIFEVYSIVSPKIAEGKPMQNLIGLVKLQFGYLYESVYSRTALGGPRQEEESALIQIPEAEYAIKDPFTGDTNGWVNCRLCIGNWNDVNNFKVAVATSTENLKVEIPIALEMSEVSKEKKEEIELSTKLQNPGGEEYFDDDILQITIHRMCGLQTLVSDYVSNEDAEFPDMIQDTMHTGLNTFVKLDIFPQQTDNDEDIIETPIVSNSFTPMFMYNIEVTLQGLDAEILRWIKNGGRAKGQIWHKVPAHLSPTNSAFTCLLGEFSADLRPLLNTPHGIRQVWFPIYCGQTNRETNASVELSISFKNGVSTGEVSAEYQFGIYQTLRIEVNLCDVALKYWLNGENGLIFCKWRFHNQNKEGMIDYSVRTSKCFECQKVDEHILSPLFSYDDQVDIELSAEMIEMIQRDSLEFQIWTKTSFDSRYIGSIYVNAFNLLSETRSFQRSRSSKLIRPVTSGRFLLINPNSAVAESNYANLSVNMRLFRSRKLFNTNNQGVDSKAEQVVNNPKTEIVTGGIEKSSSNEIHDGIIIYINIEQAINLPLINAGGAEKAPDTFVTFSDLNSSKHCTHKYETFVVQGKRNPSWGYQACTHIPKDAKSLKEIKKTGALQLSVWHLADSGASKAPSEKKFLIGKVSVPVSPLFTGFTDIFGWYPVLDQCGVSKGQIKVQIRPGQPLDSIFQQSDQKPSLNDLIIPQSPGKNGQEDTMKKSADTWSWNGSVWLHQVVDVNAGDDSAFKKSLSETMTELEKLNSNMMKRLEKIELKSRISLPSKSAQPNSPVYDLILQKDDIISRSISDYKPGTPVNEDKLLLSDLEQLITEKLDRGMNTETIMEKSEIGVNTESLVERVNQFLDPSPSANDLLYLESGDDISIVDVIHAAKEYLSHDSNSDSAVNDRTDHLVVVHNEAGVILDVNTETLNVIYFD
jgi:hypothetical protein